MISFRTFKIHSFHGKYHIFREHFPKSHFPRKWLYFPNDGRLPSGRLRLDRQIQQAWGLANLTRAPPNEPLASLGEAWAPPSSLDLARPELTGLGRTWLHQIGLGRASPTWGGAQAGLRPVIGRRHGQRLATGHQGRRWNEKKNKNLIF